MELRHGEPRDVPVILRRIMGGPRPGVTLAVWEGARSFSVLGTGEIDASREKLAELVGVSLDEVSRAMSRLVEVGALVRVGRGRYALHPGAAWSGSLASREDAERRMQPSLVE